MTDEPKISRVDYWRIEAATRDFKNYLTWCEGQEATDLLPVIKSEINEQSAVAEFDKIKRSSTSNANRPKCMRFFEKNEWERDR